MTSATAFAPASIGNVGVGFDILGLALTGPGDRVTVGLSETAGVQIQETTGIPMDLPADPEENTAGAALLALLQRTDSTKGFSLRIHKGIPLGSGLGGSAASAVGAVVAAHALLRETLPDDVLMDCALRGEAVASGTMHADNVAPCLFGGLVLTPVGGGVIPIPTPAGLTAVVVHPGFRLDTRASRSVLGEPYALEDVVQQTSALAVFLAACFIGDADAIHVNDLLVEPRRAPLIPGFAEVKAAALRSGALGASISGGGPSIFALCPTPLARAVQEAMVRAATNHNHQPTAHVSPLNAPGARLVDP